MWAVQNREMALHCKKSFSIFLSPAGMSLTKLSLGGNSLYMTSLFPPRESLVSDIPAWAGNIKKLVKLDLPPCLYSLKYLLLTWPFFYRLNINNTLRHKYYIIEQISASTKNFYLVVQAACGDNFLSVQMRRRETW